MLIPITFADASKEDAESTIYISPEMIISIEDILRDGKLSNDINIWSIGVMTPLFVTGTGLGAIADQIEQYYREVIKQPCPFMFITVNLYINVNHVSHVLRAIINGKIDPNSSSICFSGATTRIDIPNSKPVDTANAINEVIKSITEANKNE